MAWGFISKLKEMLGQIVGEAKKFMTGDIFDAAMATVVMVGWADGSFDASEKLKALQFVQNHPTMAGHTPEAVKKAFEKYDGIFQLDTSMGRDEAMKAIAKIVAAPEEARILVVRVGILIGGADGDFDDNEKKVVREICNKLGLRPSTFEL
jgi:tellurite resistance protein TerB